VPAGIQKFLGSGVAYWKANNKRNEMAQYFVTDSDAELTLVVVDLSDVIERASNGGGVSDGIRRLSVDVVFVLRST
jgi:hypothetical protein